MPYETAPAHTLEPEPDAIAALDAIAAQDATDTQAATAELHGTAAARTSEPAPDATQAPDGIPEPDAMATLDAMAAQDATGTQAALAEPDATVEPARNATQGLAGIQVWVATELDVPARDAPPGGPLEARWVAFPVDRTRRAERLH